MDTKLTISSRGKRAVRPVIKKAMTNTRTRATRVESQASCSESAVVMEGKMEITTVECKMKTRANN